MAPLELDRRSRAACLLLLGWLACAVLTGSTSAEVAAAGQAARALEPGRAAQIARLIVDPAGACLPAATVGDGAAAQPELTQAVRALRVSPVGAWLLDRAAAQDVLICLDPGTQLAAYYRSALRLIGVQAALPPAGKTLFLAHELAHVPQHPSYSNDRSLAVDDLILMHRLREAAAEAIATRVLWQMQRRGWADAWRAKLETGYGDIARAFAATMAHAGASELEATRAAFDQWFAWPLRLQHYDSHMLDHVERSAQDHPGPAPLRRQLTDDFLQGIARYAGDSFLSADAAHGLTGERYRAGLSGENAARLAAILRAGAGQFVGAAALPVDSGAPPRS